MPDPLKTLLDNLSEAVCLADEAGRLLAFNSRLFAILGLPEDSLRIGDPAARIPEILHGRGEYANEETYATVLAKLGKAGSEPFAHERQRPTGQRLEVRGNPVPGGGFVVVISDETAQRRALQALQESEQRYRDLAEIASDWQCETDEAHRITAVSGDYRGKGGRDPASVLGLTFWAAAGCPEPAADPTWVHYWNAVRERRSFHDFKYALRDPDGRMRHRRVSGRPVHDAANVFKGYRCGIRDETAEVEARARAREAEDLLGRAAESISEGIAVYDREDRLVFANTKYNRFFTQHIEPVELGRRFEDVVRQGIAGGHYPEAAGREEAFLQERLAAHRDSGKAVIYRVLGDRWIQARDYRMADGSIVAIRADVTELVGRDQALRESRESLAAAQRIAKLGSWELDLADLDDLGGNPLRWSDETYRIFGYEPGEIAVSNENFLRAVHPDDRAAIGAAMRRAIETGQTYGIDHRVLRKDGQEIVVREQSHMVRDAAGRALKMLGTVQDITEQRRTEEALRESQKMEAIGQLTGGAAHDLNNLLGIVVGGLDQLLERLDGASEEAKLAAGALDGALRGAELTRQLLAFARRQPLNPEAFAINGILPDARAVLERTLGEAIALELAMAEDLWPVFADRSRLQHALLNLALNARDAMPAGGRITIETGNVRLGEADARRNPDAKPGDYAMLAVTDTGSGMTPEVARRALEPFFTTKPAGKGTGLGLSMIYGFVRQSGGHLAIESGPGRGTSVRLYLPRAAAPAAGGPARPEPAMPEGGETILVAEDNQELRAMAVRSLEGLGYRVLEAESAEAALGLLTGAEPIDLLFSDMVLGGPMGGGALARAACARRPGLHVLLTTGYAEESLSTEEQGGLHILAKPYRKRDLALAVRRILDS